MQSNHPFNEDGVWQVIERGGRDGPRVLGPCAGFGGAMYVRDQLRELYPYRKYQIAPMISWIDETTNYPYGASN